MTNVNPGRQTPVQQLVPAGVEQTVRVAPDSGQQAPGSSLTQDAIIMAPPIPGGLSAMDMLFGNQSANPPTSPNSGDILIADPDLEQRAELIALLTASSDDGTSAPVRTPTRSRRRRSGQPPVRVRVSPYPPRVRYADPAPDVPRTSSGTAARQTQRPSGEWF